MSRLVLAALMVVALALVLWMALVKLSGLHVVAQAEEILDDH